MFRASFAKAFVKSPWFYAATITFCGSQISNLDVRGISSRGLTISLPKMSPALAALEDTIKTWGVERAAPRIAGHEITLTAGKSAVGLVDKVLRPTVPYEIRLQTWLAQIPLGGRVETAAPPVVVPTVAVALRGLTVRQPAIEKPVVTGNISAVKMPRDVVEVDQKLQASELPIGVSKIKIEVPARPLNDAASDSVPELSAARKDRLVAQLAEENWKAPTLAERLKQLIEKESAVAPTDQPVRVNNGILIASQTAEPATQTFAAPPSPGARAMAAAPTPGEVASPSAPSNKLVPSVEPVAGISWAKPDDGKAVRATLAGSIRLAGGLAVTDASEKLVIYREWEGLAVEKAQVWMSEGRFEIAASSLRGRLLGQLRDARNQVLGEGEIKLNQLTPNAASDRIDGLMLTLRPVFSGARIEVVSAHSYGQQIETVKGAKAWIMGESQELKADEDRRYFTEEGLRAGSSFVARSVADNYWGTIVVGLTGQESRARLFPDKLMDALLNLTIGTGRQAQGRSGVIWGRITRNGEPVAGAKVEMAGDHQQRSHYFNSLILPDRFAEATGENGTFAFVEVTPGIQSVRVIYQGQVWPAQIIPVERGHVSYLDFELGQPESVPLEIYDPFDGGKELNGILRWAGDETSQIEVQGRGRLGIPGGPGLVMLEADAGESYELMRYTVPRNTRRLQLPIVRRDWLLSLASRKRVNLDAGVGMAVGFGIEDDFTVYMDRAEDSGATPEIVYFDNQGKAMFSDEGSAGGGFIVFNVPPGLRTLTLASKSEKKLFRQVILASPDAVNLVLTNTN